MKQRRYIIKESVWT